MSDREARIERLLGMLQSGEVQQGWKMANHLDVSLRCLHRYVAELRKRGYPIAGDKGRGGGLLLRKKRAA